MKRSYDRSVDILVVIFILLSLLISTFALASTEEAEIFGFNVIERNRR